ncbi:cysteine-rich motor neuron 1 protein isoform X3 [Ooceraea biroi]|uniref:cysteine-rich motor neuron 1 protein isoform X3 n=1 Tax=Ooceraea biroi TaxID=2015173 RepID=UPI0005B91E58|nr:cysteine-rich motor neuron 1 protein isoform X3 [Ooceraea biroi]
MRAPLLLLGGIVVLSLAVARALSCVCSPVECDVLTDEDCPGGLTWDPCRCCKVCARVEGEPCGGLFGFSGSCAVGLQCVIVNLLPRSREMDEGVCTKIPGRWRRHCPHGPIMSDPGCNLVGEGTTEAGNAAAAGKCVCGPSVPWCPGEPRPYMYTTRHECKLNLEAKIAYDDLYNSGDTVPGSNVAVDGTSFGESTRADREQVGEGKESGRNDGDDGGWQNDERATLSTRIAGWTDLISWAKPEEKPQNCIHEGVSRKLGEEWKQNDCATCICNEDGTASCQTTMCKSCENAIPPDPGECCPHCPPPTNSTFDHHHPDEPCKTSLDDCEMKCYHGFRTDENHCPVCECADDLEVDAVPDVLPEDYKVCPELLHCELNCDLLKDEDGCSVCACQTPSLPPRYPAAVNDTALNPASTGRSVCPELKCNLHCEQGLLMDENDCTLCECKPPTTGCPSLLGCRKRCNFGYKTNKRGCPICRCRATCMDHLNETHAEGSIWHPNSCTTCICEAGGRLNCKETICSVACGNPLPPKSGTCCPMCPITTIKENETVNQITSRGWGTVPITLIVVLALLCLLLIIHIVRSRFRGRLSPSEASYVSSPPQYYKCVPVYDTPVHRNEKIVPL